MHETMGEWVHRFIFPDGSMTNGSLDKGAKNNFKTRVIQNLDLKDKRVLDLGCADGLFSFYMAEEGARVVGLEIEEGRIERANYAKTKLNFTNVEFFQSDIMRQDVVKKLGNFDVGFCFALIHRVPDPFNLIATLAVMCESLVFEWKSPQGFFPRKVSLAFHETTSFFDFKNINADFQGTLNKSSEVIKGMEKPYWTLSEGALREILESFGFVHFQTILITPRNPFKIALAWVLFLLQCMRPGGSPISWRRSQRIMLLASKKRDFTKVSLNKPINRTSWDGTLT